MQQKKTRSVKRKKSRRLQSSDKLLQTEGETAVETLQVSAANQSKRDKKHQHDGNNSILT